MTDLKDEPDVPLICPVCERIADADAWTLPGRCVPRCPVCHANGVGWVVPRPLVGEELGRWLACEATGW